jgi:dephospho-CoA kinase
MTFVLGLTGSVGMGKSTTAAMFAEAGVPVWDADAAVHRLYAPGQAGALVVGRLFPDSIAPDGGVDRARLRQHIQTDPTALDRLNSVVHPLVATDRAEFLTAHAAADIVLLDVPLLFETGLDQACDAVAVVSAPADVQRQRVLARGVSGADLDLILSRQMPDAEKRARAGYVIPTTGLDVARAAVKNVIADIRRRTDQDA